MDEALFPMARSLGLAHQRQGELSDGFRVQLRKRADLQEFAACILILDGLQNLSVIKHTSGPPSLIHYTSIKEPDPQSPDGVIMPNH